MCPDTRDSSSNYVLDKFSYMILNLTLRVAIRMYTPFGLYKKCLVYINITQRY